MRQKRVFPQTISVFYQPLSILFFHIVYDEICNIVINDAFSQVPLLLSTLIDFILLCMICAAQQ